MNQAERRRHLRHKDPESVTVRLLIGEGESERPLTGLTVDESHGGLACVFVGPAIEVGLEILWQETEGISTSCKVMRCQQLHPGVHLIALQILG
jgi:hypothetical protein